MLETFGLIPHACKTAPTGAVFGRLTVLEVGKPPGSYRYKAICQCECGSAPRAIRIDGLRCGAVVSCGCVHREVSRKHGLSKHPLYTRWRKMIRRCTNPDDHAFENYGGRGITVCERWLSVEAFVADMEADFRPELEIDRRDNNGPYSPENCRWATPAQNADNRRSGRRHLTLNGKTQSIVQWAKETGLRYQCIWDRVALLGWSDERALLTPPRRKKPVPEKAAHARLS